MSPWDFPGFVSGLAASWLFLIAVLVAAAASVRVLTTLRKPGKGRAARGLLVWAAMAGLVAVVLFGVGQTPATPASVKVVADRAAPWIGAAALVAAPLFAWAAGRRARRREPVSVPPAAARGGAPEPADEGKP